MLYARAGLVLEEPYSRHLMVRELPELDAAGADGAAEASPGHAEPAMLTHDTQPATVEGESALPSSAQQVPA